MFFVRHVYRSNIIFKIRKESFCIKLYKNMLNSADLQLQYFSNALCSTSIKLINYEVQNLSSFLIGPFPFEKFGKKEFHFRSSKFAIQSLKFVDLLDVLHRTFVKFDLIWKTLICILFWKYFLFINIERKVIGNVSHHILEDMYPLWSRMLFLAEVVGAQQLEDILNEINC